MVLALFQVQIMEARGKDSHDTARYCALRELEVEEDGYRVVIQQRNERRALVELRIYV